MATRNRDDAFWTTPKVNLVQCSAASFANKSARYHRNPFLSPSRIYLGRGRCLELKQLRLRTVLPNFLIIGAMKSGTSSLHYYLGRHDDIYTPNLKEPGLFLDYSNEIPIVSSMSANQIKMGLSNDQLLRTLLNGYHGEKMFGESSTFYTKAPYMGSEVPARLSKLCPDMKFIYLVRNPLARIVAQYRHHAAVAKQPFNGGRPVALTQRPFNEELAENPGAYVELSRYFAQLNHYLRFFPKASFKVIVFERFVKNVPATLKNVFEFLGVESRQYDGGNFKVYNEGKQRTRKVFGEIRYSAANYVRVMSAVSPDLTELKHFMADDIPEWDISAAKWCDFQANR
ncbi:MAG: sulfotransferase [Candidatus Omnitrophota bacterium]|nr:sulfotransferase [Candidatus Omnitrophota bacterium]